MLPENQILKARKAVESMYAGKCTVTEHQKVRDRESKLVTYEDNIVLENQPCRISFQNTSAAGKNDAAAAVAQTVKLFVSPDIVIRPGSKIAVTQNDITTDYTYSGVPAVYMTHQEFVLELFERWA